MKKIIIATIFILIYTYLFSQVSLDPRYHTYDEIKAELDSLQNLYPDLVFVDSIGVTFTDSIPIWAVKLSNNASVDEDEPAVLYVGQCHAEEVLGVEITMYMINDILEHHYMSPYNVWLYELEMWFIPSINPEGLQVVMDGLDISFRKNKRDNNLNGIFDYDPGEGGDIDGVDPNRNYSFNWVHGDTLYHIGPEQWNDYYRGPAPFSEAETRAVLELAKNQHFIFSINWHSSRTGNFSEKIFYSFKWDGDKCSPDFAVNQIIGETVAGLIVKEGGSGHYEPSPSTGRKGNAHDWFYQANGTIQLLIECGTSNIQPDSALIEDTCNRCSVGAYWLLNRAIGYNTDAAMLTGHICDSITKEPIAAEVIIEGYDASYFAPRMSDELYGRFWRVLNPGTYNIKFVKKGYKDSTINNVTINNSCQTDLSIIELQHLPEANYSGIITCGQNPVPAEIIVFDIENDTIHSENGEFNFTSYEGEHTVWIMADNCVPVIDSLNVVGGTFQWDIELKPDTVHFYEDWENGTDNWDIIGDWGIIEDSHNGNYSLTDSPDEFYSSNSTVMITTHNPISLSDVGDDVILSFWQKYHTEWDNDICSVQISTDGNNWEQIYSISGVYQTWHRILLPLKNWLNESIFIRFKLTTDGTLTDPGWIIDDIKIVSSAGTPVNNNLMILPNKLILYQNYPNPCNPQTTIKFQIPNSIGKLSEFDLSIYNIKGEQIKQFRIKDLDTRSVIWNGKDNKNRDVPIGIYLYRLKVKEKSVTKKMVLLR